MFLESFQALSYLTNIEIFLRIVYRKDYAEQFRSRKTFNVSIDCEVVYIMLQSLQFESRKMTVL